MNYNDLTRPCPKWWFMWGMAPQPPYFRLVKCYNSPNSKESTGQHRLLEDSLFQASLTFKLPVCNTAFHVSNGYGHWTAGSRSVASTPTLPYELRLYICRRKDGARALHSLRRVHASCAAQIAGIWPGHPCKWCPHGPSAAYGIG